MKVRILINAMCVCVHTYVLLFNEEVNNLIILGNHRENLLSILDGVGVRLDYFKLNSK